MRKVKISIVLCIVLLVMIACSKNNEEVINETEEVHVYPFTGLETNEDVNHRAIAVMVSNQVQARPQSGLTKADIVYEMLTEGNITRFMAIYHSDKPEVVGPIRSAREYFVELANDMDAVYIYSGAANFVNDLIDEKGIEHIEADQHAADGAPFLRETFRKSPHNLYMKFSELPAFLKKEEVDMDVTHKPLSFLDDDTEIEGEEANYVKISYYKSDPIVEYTYDEKTEKYSRYNNGEITDELESEIPIEIDNLLVVEAEHEVIDKELRRSINLHSGGKGYLFQRGKVQEVEWKNQDGNIVPMIDGEVVPFVTGKTWVNVVQTEPEKGVKEQVHYSNDGK